MSIAMLVLTGLLAAPAPHTADWHVTPDRTWIGKDWWANRLQDWAIEDGTLVCLQAGNKKPLRTAHWITRSIDTADGPVDLSVDIAPADRGSVAPPSAFAGFLIGTGGEHVDYRLSALAHHLPAPDGGLLAVVDGDGVVALRRFDQPFAGKAIWSVNTEVALDNLPLLEGQTRTGEGFQGNRTRRCRLELHVEGKIVAIKAIGDHGGVISTAVAMVGDANLLDGAVAMVSSSGPDAAKGRGFAFSHLHGSGGGLLHHPDRAYGP
ncbi:MAG: hypothetical protein QF723_04825, partial [Phycisphaerales bacterium]|nr:hypothetical protein [Phycisphaerales bacterium]